MCDAGLYVHNAQHLHRFRMESACFPGRNVLKFHKEVRIVKDIPMFTTEFGVASLVLAEIPYRQEAYIRLRSVQPGKLPEMIAECVSFCRMVGAERIYAAGHEDLEEYPLKAAILDMKGDALVDWNKVENIFPVTEQTFDRWREVCNTRMADVDCAATITAADEKKVLASGGAYFVHHEGELLGTGWMEEEKLLLICSVKPGAGERVMHTLMSLVEGSRIRLEVASTNVRAIRLYEQMGFIAVGEVSRWYRVFG